MHLPLLVWRIIRGLEASLSRTPPSASWRPSTAARYDSVWHSFKDFPSAHGVLISIDLMVVHDYLTHLADRGLAYRTITLHRSVLSATQWTDTRLVITISYHVIFEAFFRIVLLRDASLHHGMWWRYLPFSHLLCLSILSLSSANWPFCSPWRLRCAPLRWLRYAAARRSWLSPPALYVFSHLALARRIAPVTWVHPF